jgi:hypothetical protein
MMTCIPHPADQSEDLVHGAYPDVARLRSTRAVKIGLAAIGIGAGARPATLRAIGSAGDATGFATLWMGQHVGGVRSFPKPVRGGRLPVILGGESRAALGRAAEYGDGWYGVNLSPEEATERIAVLRSLLQQRQRDPAAFEIVVAPFTKPIRPADLTRYQAAGVDEVAIVASPPRDESRVTAWVEDLANEWVRAAGILA